MIKLDELLEDVEEVRRLTIQPGDILVFRFKHRLRVDTANEIGEHLKAKLGEDVKILILDQGTAIDILEKTDGASPP
jgi:hypothetical protein